MDVEKRDHVLNLFRVSSPKMFFCILFVGIIRFALRFITDETFGLLFFLVSLMFSFYPQLAFLLFVFIPRL